MNWRRKRRDCLLGKRQRGTNHWPQWGQNRTVTELRRREEKNREGRYEELTLTPKKRNNKSWCFYSKGCETGWPTAAPCRCGFADLTCIVFRLVPTSSIPYCVHHFIMYFNDTEWLRQTFERWHCVGDLKLWAVPLDQALYLFFLVYFGTNGLQLLQHASELETYSLVSGRICLSFTQPSYEPNSLTPISVCSVAYSGLICLFSYHYRWHGLLQKGNTALLLEEAKRYFIHPNGK